MPRTARAAQRNICYHVINRGNNRSNIFHNNDDYRYFETLLARAKKRIPIRILSWCLMPNHFHLLLYPFKDGDLGRWMHWLLTSHVQMYLRKYEVVGRIWQGRYKAPPIQQDCHLLCVMRYIERNPLRARIVQDLNDWEWSSFRRRTTSPDPLLDPAPIELPEPWSDFVRVAITQTELDSVRSSLVSGRPLGDPVWVNETAEILGLNSTLRPRGRPRKTR
jgi:putative transposase